MKRFIFVSIAIIMGLMFIRTNVSFAENKTRKSIFEFKQELSLTDKQETNLREIVTKLQDYLTKKQKELSGLRVELNKMIADKANLGQIRAKLNNMGRIQADATYEDIASTRAIEKELTEVQLSKWRSMQAEFSKNLKQAQEAQAAAVKQKVGEK